ncbi:hypothetical protein KVT40_003251 [Elsinoe batatas]|uniref:Essential protein Yae1 N-terminal domain-containing protein n=1 Tax=Elsinoe batatas TaxID=2601811 RepID=A0A8K0PGW0_9PEZI|nr:hypothetical protein KVT40_003251 [Elsinoe batatas]
MKFDDVDAESGVDPSWAIKRHASERTKSKVWYGLLGITVTALTGTLILRSSSIPCTLRQDLFQHYDKVLEPIDDPNKNISVNAGWEFAGYPTFANNQCGALVAVAEHDDPFDSLLTLESQFHAEGHALGVADGSKAGRIEGRIFGMQKGFEKFAAMGKLAGQVAVWEGRMMVPSPSIGGLGGTRNGEEAREEVNVTDPSATIELEVAAEGSGTAGSAQGREEKLNLPPIQHNERLQKHIATLAALTEAASLDTQNTEEAVSDFDDRLKRAEGKAKIIASIVGEAQPSSKEGGSRHKRDAGSNMEDFTLPRSGI